MLVGEDILISVKPDNKTTDRIADHAEPYVKEESKNSGPDSPEKNPANVQKVCERSHLRT